MKYFLYIVYYLLLKAKVKITLPNQVFTSYILLYNATIFLPVLKSDDFMKLN